MTGERLGGIGAGAKHTTPKKLVPWVQTGNFGFGNPAVSLLGYYNFILQNIDTTDIIKIYRKFYET